MRLDPWVVVPAIIMILIVASILPQRGDDRPQPTECWGLTGPGWC